MLIHQHVIVFFFLCIQKQFRIHSLPLFFSSYFIFRGFQKILLLDSYLFVAIIQTENFSFFYPISLLLINTPQKMQNLCLLTLIFDAHFSLATYYTHPSYFQQMTFHLCIFFGIKAWELFYLHIATLISSVFRKHSKLYLHILFRTSPGLLIFPAYNVAQCAAISCSAYTEDLQMTSFLLPSMYSSHPLSFFIHCF